MSEVKELPKGWEWKKISEIANLYRGITYTKDVASTSEFKGSLPILRGNNINEELNYDDLVYVPKSLIKKEQMVKKDDIVFAMSSGSKHLVGKSAVAKNDFEGSYGAFCALLRIENSVDKAYVRYVFKGNTYRKLISEIAKGTNINNLKREHILDFKLPLPPFETQQAIVSKIEELFSEIDKGIENLRTAQQQLKTYRQSVLKWAFEGKLTEEWRKKNTKKVKGSVPRAGTPARQTGGEPNDLPEGWIMTPVKEVAETYGGYAFKSGEFKNEGKYQVLRMGNVRPGIIRFEEKPAFINKVDASVLSRALLKVGDVIITQTGTRQKRDYGFTALIPKENLLLNQRIAAIRFGSKYLSRFFLYYSWTDDFKDQFFANETGNVGQGNVGMKAVTETLVPNCSIQEQQAIVEEIESRLSVADKMEESIATSLQQAEALKQSILKMAFEGRLVSEVDVVREKAITKPSKKSKIIKLPVEVYPRIKEGIAATDLHAGIIAMIVDLHEKHPEHLINLTHVKCEKIAHLVEVKLGISLGRMPVKDAAGPDDFPHLKKVEHSANKCNWLKVIKQDIGYTYQSKSGASKIITKVETVLSSSELNQVKSLMNEFLKFDLERSEVIATVYAGWNNLLILGQQPTDEEIVFESRENWSKRKLLIDREKFFKALIWMRKHGYIPEGKGSLILKKSEIQ